MDTPQEDPNQITVDSVRKNYELFYNPHGPSVWVQPKGGAFKPFSVTKAQAIERLLKGALLSIPDQLFWGEVREVFRQNEEVPPRNDDSMYHYQKIDLE